MDQSNFTPRAQQILPLARKEALRFHHNYIGTEHVLLALVALGQGVAVNVLQKFGIELEMLREAVARHVGIGEMRDEEVPTPTTPRVKKVFSLAVREARALSHTYIGTEHILLGLLREGEGVASRVLRELGVDIEKTRKEIVSVLDPNSPSYAFASGMGEDDPRAKNSFLKTFGRDLTELAKAGSLDPVIGRADEIRRVVQILARRTKNNPVLIGEAGVGKTAIVEGLAQEIASASVPDILLGKRVVTLDLALMVAGTKYRGQFEERIKGVMDEIKKAKNVILFLDELHTLVGAGGAEGAMDASNILKPALSRGELQCIGATTLVEFRKHIEKDAALERRFQSVTVNDPSVEDAILILNGIRGRYEEHHKCTYMPGAIEAAVRLSDRYIPARHLPDKAIDVLDEAGAYVRINTFQRPPAVEEIQRQLDALQARKEQAVAGQQFEEAAKIRDEEQGLREKREKTLEEWRAGRAESRVEVTEDDMYKVVAGWTGIPLARMEKKETQKLLELEDSLQSLVVGQRRACEVIARALRRSRADLKDPRRPIGSFLFLGPTGVGKTMLAKTLALNVFEDEKALVQIDMSEYMEKHALSRLIGAPPGYVGHEEAGQLSEAVRRRPYSVVLFDEIEKAHPDIVQILLQVLEDGRLTDSQGRTVDFRNTIIIMTSNVGADVLQRNSSMGFGVGVGMADDYARTKEKILDETKRFFKPEFLNRLSEIVIFTPLSKSDIGRIVENETGKLRKRLQGQGIVLDIAPEVREFLAVKGYDEKFGARPLRRAIERYLEDPLAEKIIREELVKGAAPVFVTLADGVLEAVRANGSTGAIGGAADEFAPEATLLFSQPTAIAPAGAPRAADNSRRRPRSVPK
ncbi:MAG: ATP-dependent Clp protease ATP-binding subunit [Puniceicoccales bacterium]|jgi:ATP-dependent Clp protease ATP-binding subunit ClpC|nr:ATP-dependent Clp protease ATP-binding subunit [Puniceicoccales bacterium]